MPDLDRNPLLQAWSAPFGLPPFDRIAPEQFVPAFEHAMRLHADEVNAIADATAAPTFDYTIAALDRTGRALVRIELLFHNLTGSETSPALEAVEREMAPRLAAHRSAVYLDPKLFERIDLVHRQRASLGLDPESLRLVERVHLDFVRAGAHLCAAD